MEYRQLLLLIDFSLRLAPSCIRGCRGFIEPSLSTTLNKSFFYFIVTNVVHKSCINTTFYYNAYFQIRQ